MINKRQKYRLESASLRSIVATMMMNLHTVVLLVILAIAAVIAAVFGTISDVVVGRGLQVYWQRACTGRLWKCRFPSASKVQIRAFLDLFVGAFGFNRRRRLCFSPDDRVLDVYRTLYPPKWMMPDCLELERFVGDMLKKYGTDVVPCWREDITLGDLFSRLKVSPHP